MAQCPGAKFQNDLLDRKLLKSDEFGHSADPWIQRAQQAHEANNCFEALIYLWIPFNAWLGQVVKDRTRTEKDWYLVNAAGRDKTMAERFGALIIRDTNLGQLVHRFHRLWPVFKVRTLDEFGIEPWSGDKGDRHTYRAKCFSSGILNDGDYAPVCARDHQPDKNNFGNFSVDNIPLDWAHTLSAIYKTRCNLFHGGKNFANFGDQLFVGLAFPILWSMWAAPELKIYGWAGA